jgi:ABC-type Mn2+/Zn2+ transport system permease subunit
VPWDALVDPLLAYPFMRFGLAAAAIVGVTSGALSCLLVIRRQALLGDAIAHSVLLGVALGWIAARHAGVLWGALIVGVLAGIAIAAVEQHSRVALDAAMGIVFTAAFALGLVVISVARPRGIDLFHVLFGNVIGVGPDELIVTAVSGFLVLAAVVVLLPELRLWTFDPEQARALGVRTGALHYLFTALLAAAIVAGLQTVGLVLVIALLVTPGATAYLLTERLVPMMVVAAVIGLLAGIAGLYSSYYADIPSGPAIVLAASIAFLTAFLAAPRRGLLPRLARRRGRRTRKDDPGPPL